MKQSPQFFRDELRLCRREGLHVWPGVNDAQFVLVKSSTRERNLKAGSIEVSALRRKDDCRCRRCYLRREGACQHKHRLGGRAMTDFEAGGRSPVPAPLPPLCSGRVGRGRPPKSKQTRNVGEGHKQSYTRVRTAAPTSQGPGSAAGRQLRGPACSLSRTHPNR